MCLLQIQDLSYVCLLIPSLSSSLGFFLASSVPSRQPDGLHRLSLPKRTTMLHFTVTRKGKLSAASHSRPEADES